MMEESAAKIILGNSTSQLILIPLPDARVNHDHVAQLTVQVQARAGTFSGKAEMIMPAESFYNLSRALKTFLTQPRGEFTLASVSQGLWVSITGDGSGQFTAHGTLEDGENRYTRLRFEVRFSRNDIPAIRKSIARFISEMNI